MPAYFSELAGITCTKGSGPTEMSPVNGRSWEAMSKIDAATPVANIASVMADASRLSLCTMAVATRAQTACRIRHNHLTAWTSDRLTRMR